MIGLSTVTIFTEKYWQRRLGGQSIPYLVDASGSIPMGSQGWLGTSADHLLRTYYDPVLSVHVATASPPNFLWWKSCYAIAVAWWADASDTTFYLPDSDYDGLLITERMATVMVVDPAATAGYTVQFRSDHGPLSAKTGRRPQGGVTSPAVFYGVQLFDPMLGVAGHLHAGTQVDASGFQETLWGTPA